jgi:hypothetical protein
MSGYYKAWLVMTLAGATAGFNNEFIHVYAGLTSPIPPIPDPIIPQPAPRIVSDYNLTPYFAAPATWAVPNPQDAQFEAGQYDGTIQWTPALPDSGTFAPDTVYTAVVTLIAADGYTFTGISSNFAHGSITGTTGTNNGTSVVVTIVFPSTDAAGAGAFSISINFNHGKIEVSGSNGENTIYKNGEPKALSLGVTGYDKIAWYVDADLTALSGNPVILNAADYALGRHTVMFNGEKDGVPFSERVYFTVEQGEEPEPSGRFVMVGSSGQIAYSIDRGQNWTTVNITPRDEGWIKAAYGDGTFVVIDGEGKGAYSTNGGLTWTETSMPLPYINVVLGGLAYGTGTFVAGINDKIVYSLDKGKTWAESTSLLPGNFDLLGDIAYGNGKFVAINRYPDAPPCTLPMVLTGQRVTPHRVFGGGVWPTGMAPS